MARGRQQKWICKDCGGEFCVQGKSPKFCCACGSSNIGRAPSLELALNYEEKRKELEIICAQLNPLHSQYIELKNRYNANMAYWKQQKRRGFISAEEYEEYRTMFVAEHKEAEE